MGGFWNLEAANTDEALAWAPTPGGQSFSPIGENRDRGGEPGLGKGGRTRGTQPTTNFYVLTYLRQTR